MEQKGIGRMIRAGRWFGGSLLITVVMCVVVSVLLWGTSFPERYTDLSAIICCCSGCITAGFGGGRIMGQRGMIWGICFGILYLFLLFLILYCMSEGTVFPQFFRVSWLICICLSGVSGTFSVNLRK